MAKRSRKDEQDKIPAADDAAVTQPPTTSASEDVALQNMVEYVDEGEYPEDDPIYQNTPWVITMGPLTGGPDRRRRPRTEQPEP
jgi:hypothetical protein